MARSASAHQSHLHDERSEETRARLLDAALDSVIAVGYLRTCPTEVADRAGVSRDAQAYHDYPSKAALASAAVGRLLERRHEELRRLCEQQAKSGASAVDAALNFLWRVFEERTFSAWIELVVASRSDPELRAAVARMSDDFLLSVQRTMHTMFRRAAHNPVLRSAELVFAMLGGLAISRTLYDDPARCAHMLSELRDIAYALQPTSSAPLVEPQRAADRLRSTRRTTTAGR